MAVASMFGTTDDGSGLKARMHQITVNENGIATDVREFTAQGDLLNVYRRFDFRNFNNIQKIDKRYFHSDSFTVTRVMDNRTPELAAQVRELAK